MAVYNATLPSSSVDHPIPNINVQPSQQAYQSRSLQARNYPPISKCTLSTLSLPDLVSRIQANFPPGLKLPSTWLAERSAVPAPSCAPRTTSLTPSTRPAARSAPLAPSCARLPPASPSTWLAARSAPAAPSCRRSFAFSSAVGCILLHSRKSRELMHIHFRFCYRRRRRRLFVITLRNFTSFQASLSAVLTSR